MKKERGRKQQVPVERYQPRLDNIAFFESRESSSLGDLVLFLGKELAQPKHPLRNLSNLEQTVNGVDEAVDALGRRLFLGFQLNKLGRRRLASERADTIIQVVIEK